MKTNQNIYGNDSPPAPPFPDKPIIGKPDDPKPEDPKPDEGGEG